MSSPFILHSSVKDLKDSIVENTVLHLISRHSSSKGKIESHAMPGHGMSAAPTRIRRNMKDGFRCLDPKSKGTPS